MRRYTNRILIGGFLAALLAPTVATVFGFDPMGELYERRALAPRPNTAAIKYGEPASVAAYTQGWENYYNDHFGFRKLLIGYYRFALLRVMHLSANPGAVVGKSDGQIPWLFFDGAGAKDGLGIDAYLGKVPFAPGELAHIHANIVNLSRLFANNEQKFLVVACPDKHSIYPEYLPSALQPVSGDHSRLEQMSKTVSEVLGERYVDLRAPLMKAKAEHQVYWRTDTHWNAMGAFVAYTAILQALRKQDPGRAPLPMNEVKWVASGPGHGDLVGLLGVPYFPYETTLEAVLPPIDTLAGRKRGKLLILHDSFFDALKPFLELEFQEVKAIRGIQMSSGFLLTQELLTAVKPDVVIIESVERIWTR